MFAAVDVGGTKTLVAVFNTKGEIVEQQKFSTPQSYKDFKIELEKVVAKLSTKEVARAVAAIPAKLDRKHGVALAFGNLNWVNIPFQHDLELIFNAPVRLENDSKLAALSEALVLRPKYHKILYVTISTGINAGLIVDGKIDPDYEDMEAGQLLLEHRGKLMDWEDFASGRAFQEKFGRRVSEVDKSETAVWYWFARNIAVGLIDLIATLTPEVIIIGGGAGGHLEKFQNKLQEELKIYENPMFTIPPIVKAQRADEAVIYGCYELARQHHESR